MKLAIIGRVLCAALVATTLLDVPVASAGKGCKAGKHRKYTGSLSTIVLPPTDQNRSPYSSSSSEPVQIVGDPETASASSERDIGVGSLGSNATPSSSASPSSASSSSTSSHSHSMGNERDIGVGSLGSNATPSSSASPSSASSSSTSSHSHSMGNERDIGVGSLGSNATPSSSASPSSASSSSTSSHSHSMGNERDIGVGSSDSSAAASSASSSSTSSHSHSMGNERDIEVGSSDSSAAASSVSSSSTSSHSHSMGNETDIEVGSSDSSATASSTSSSSSSHSKRRPFQKVTALQARVQGDMPQWNADNQRFVSAYYTTFDEKYRAVLDTVNMAAVEGALKYVQAECINASVVTNCKRKNNIKYVVFYQTMIVQPAPAMDYYANGTDEYDYAVEHCPFMAMDGGQCDPNEDGSFPDVCNQYIGADGQPDLGFCIGGTLQDNEAIAPYPHNYWFSFPNSCPQSRWRDKTAECRTEYDGGMCPLGVDPDGVTCTFSYEVLGYIPLDDVVGITSMTNPKTDSHYANYSEFCQAGGVEFSASVTDNGVTMVEGLDFWSNPGDSDANAQRAEKLVAAYGALVSTNAMTSDGGVMKPLPTVASLTSTNPPCYQNSPTCANAEFGCKRSYRSQICEVCTSAETGCVAMQSH